jgi:hypothetical protein
MQGSNSFSVKNGSSKIFLFSFLEQGVCHTVALPFTFKKDLKAKERIMETQRFHHAKI